MCHNPDLQHILCEALEHAVESIVVVDPDGRIMFMNKSYREFLGVENVEGRHVTEVIENTRMHIVAKTGQAEIASIQRIKGHDMIANRVPIFDNGRVIAVLGTVVFRDVRELHALAATVERLKQEVDYYKEELRRKLSATYGLDHIVGTSPQISQLKNFARKVARSDSTVLITGESGTGKELFAHAIHAESPRALGPFVRVNCAAIPEGLLESELFGYEEGAFTGAARKGKKGKFELANHGTILLDEIGDMPLTLQSKLLRVLQEKEIERVGGARPISVDVRVISATNRELRDLIRQGRFREDLFYRLNVVTLHVPPLRERLEDLREIVPRLLKQLEETTGRRVNHIADDVWPVLQHHTWPGNVRELRNVLERALHLMEGDHLKAEHIVIPVAHDLAPGVVTGLKEAVRAAERSAIIRALAAAGGDKAKATALLKISKSSLYQKMREHGIEL